MRGKVYLSGNGTSGCRITPAYAGKSDKRTPYPQAELGSPPPMRGKVCFPGDFVLVFKDHPRLCGEKVHRNALCREIGGSPPPMRGKVLFLHVDDIPCRITPAYAGKSICRCESYAICWDHPRLCGEKGVILVNSGAVAGSPPPMRGKDVESKGTDQKFRITPAYAGKSRRICLP